MALGVMKGYSSAKGKGAGAGHQARLWWLSPTLGSGPQHRTFSVWWRGSFLRRRRAPEGTVVRDGRARAGARVLLRPLLQAGKEGDGFWDKVGIILLLLTHSLTHLDTQSHDIE